MDPSLESNMILVIVRMILYAEKRDVMVRRGDARRSLENVNKWNRMMLSSKDVNHDVAVWLTRLDIGGPSGYAPVSGVCYPARSCALNRDEGLTSTFIIAHEVAHMSAMSSIMSNRRLCVLPLPLGGADILDSGSRRFGNILVTPPRGNPAIDSRRLRPNKVGDTLSIVTTECLRPPS
ncbi:A disintegrin and metalloproteinase with thrombospondin motifs 3-like [Bombus affinis]|uniref:A disintegrin and metalloproteinase with thrombospondin motifs 3-like n=2 Tax=Bombus affinis TaxID=309941 RepID=UPI0021B72E40|nr:A disintegrin and metalloproteinase with thrombospondin motifs 3-like [Bombus affinis]